MRFFKWKFFVYTSIVCLLPVLWGILIWDRLPQSVAIHFNMYGVPDNYASKEFAVFGLPLLMVLIQAFCCFVNDFNEHKHGTRKKFEMATKWIVPFMTVVLQVVTLGYSLGWNIDIGKTASIIVACVFLIIGNYLPKFDYIKKYDIESEKARKINRFIGYETVVMGILFLISVFLAPIYRIICVFLLIPYAIIATVYGIMIGTKKYD